MIDELERFARLWKHGALTDAEFQAQKDRLFANGSAPPPAAAAPEAAMTPPEPEPELPPIQPTAIPDIAADAPTAPAMDALNPSAAPPLRAETPAASTGFGALPKWAIGGVIAFMFASGGIGFALNSGGAETPAEEPAPPPVENVVEPEPAPVQTQTLLLKALELGVGTTEDFHAFRDDGGLNADSNWHGLGLRNVNVSYDAAGKVKNFLAVTSPGASPNAIKAAVNDYCGFQPDDWKRDDMGNFTSGKAINAKCDALYLPFDENGYWTLVVAVPGTSKADEETQPADPAPSPEDGENDI